MATVTYKHQPGTAGVLKQGTPIEGTSHVYRVEKVLWPEQVEAFIPTLFVGRTLHVCCGKSKLGDVRLDLHEDVDIQCDASNMRGVVADDEFDTVLCDPPYNGKFQWNHDLLSELSRCAKQRIIFQHWFMPINPTGRWKKWNEKFQLTAVYLWQPRTYFGRVQVISVLDRDPNFQSENIA